MAMMMKLAFFCSLSTACHCDTMVNKISKSKHSTIKSNKLLFNTMYNLLEKETTHQDLENICKKLRSHFNSIITC